MIHSLLEQYFPWYSRLPEEAQAGFQQRVQLIIKGRQFKGRQQMDVTNAHKVLIGAAAAWVTRGVDKFYYPHFNLITVYPSDYFTLIKKRYQKDSIQLPGAAVVAWENLEREYTTQPLPFQSLFHEFAHAVYHENVVESEGYATIDSAILVQFQFDYVDLINNRLPAEADFLAEHNRQHPQQFFASASEYFFTDPDQLAKEVVS